MGAMRTGGQGSVYKGRRMGPIISAIKLLPTPIYAENEHDKNFKTFKNEVDKLKKVNANPNPNVVKILNSGITESGSLPFIEMEYIDGPDLEELLQRPHQKIFTINEAIKVADQLANALAHCHKVGVKHGDIKSNNVKYNIHSGNYVLLDFGLAIMSDEQRRTSMRHAGAIEFMAPEQNTGQMLFQTDVYSYGVVLYELLAGQVPFPLQDNGETSRNTVMVAHMESLVPDLEELRKANLPAGWSSAQKEKEMHVPQWLLRLIGKCLEKDPENRYSNGIALQEAVIEGSAEYDLAPGENAGLNMLKEENEQLRSQLLSYQRDTNKQVKISRPVFAGLSVLFIAAVIFGSFGMFSKKPEARSTPAKAYKPFVLYYPVSAAALAKKDAGKVTGINRAGALINNDSVKLAKKRILQNAHKKHRPKKKKFLGIFSL